MKSFFFRAASRRAFVASFGAAAAAVSMALLAGCGGGGGSSSNNDDNNQLPTGTRVVAQPNWAITAPAYVQPQKKWTFLVYLNAANDLEEFGPLNMNQMERIGSDRNINMVVQFKRIKGQYDTSSGDWGGTRRYYVRKDNDSSVINSFLLSQNDTSDMGRPQTLQEFIQWGMQTYPAERYCLVLWNHGSGWRSVKETPGRSVATRGISFDDATDNHISMLQLPSAIQRIDGQKWDVLAFDASLMQMAEVAYQVRNQANLIVGSEESPPGEGYPYDKFLGPLQANPNMSSQDFAFRIVDETLNSYGVDSNVTHSVLDAAKVGDIAPAVNDLGSALMNAKSRYGSQIAAARNTSENYTYPQNSDLLDFVRLLVDPTPGTAYVPVPDAGVQQAAARVRSAVNAAILRNVNGSQHPNSNGLAIFLPSPLSYSRIDIDQADGNGPGGGNVRYTELDFIKAAPNWASFLSNGPD